MNRSLLTLLGLLGVVLILFLCVCTHQGQIESDLQSRSAEALKAAGISVPSLVFEGRDASLRGYVATRDIAGKAAQTVADVYGVRTVHNQLSVEIPSSANNAASEKSTPAAAELRKRMRVNLDSLLAIQSVEFELNSGRISTNSYALLNEIATTLKKYPDATIEVAGHTDSQGEAESNQTLSQQRAESVKQYLIARGIAGQRLRAKGYGESRPLATNSTAAGRVQNRRVEFNLLEDK